MGYTKCKMLRKDFRAHRKFFFISTLILFLSFSFNLFGAVSTEAFLRNFKDSESLITNQIICRGQPYAGQLLEAKDATKGNVQTKCDPTGLKPYSSQYGLQGKVYTAGYIIATKVTHMRPLIYVALAQLLTALASAACLALIALWARARFGRIPAITLVLLVSISPMIVGFARNLYWALPLLLLPIVYVLYGFPSAKNNKGKLLFWALLAVLLYIRFLCGYEYITTITFMVAALVAYHLYMQKSTVGTYIRQMTIVGIVAVMSFAAALGTHIVSLNGYTGSTKQSITIIKQRAIERTTNSKDYLSYPYKGLKFTLGDFYSTADSYFMLDNQSDDQSEVISTLVSYVNYALLPVVTSPVTLNQPFGSYIESLTMFVGILGGLFYTRHKWCKEIAIRDLNAMYLAALIGLAGYISWLVLAHSHSLVHPHINGILMYLPFALFGYLIVGVFIQSMTRKVILRYKR